MLILQATKTADGAYRHSRLGYNYHLDGAPGLAARRKRGDKAGASGGKVVARSGAPR
jgi:hypothetical protein